MKNIIMLLSLVFATSAFSAESTETQCVVRKGWFFTFEPYKQGDFIGSTVYKVETQTNSNGEFSANIVKEVAGVNLVQTVKEEAKLKSVIKKYFLGFHIAILDEYKYDVVQPQWELKNTASKKEIVDYVQSLEKLNSKYKTVPCSDYRVENKVSSI